MALTATHNQEVFGVGDKVRVIQKIKEGEKSRNQAFEGMVIAIKGREKEKSFTVRKIGIQQVGIERIFPLTSPSIEKIEVVRAGAKGTRHAKLYFTRDKSKKEIESIFSRAFRKSQPAKAQTTSKKPKAKSSSKKQKPSK